MTTLDRLKLMLAALDSENGCNRWWQRVYGLPDRTTAADVWAYLHETAQPMKPKRVKRDAA